MPKKKTNSQIIIYQSSDGKSRLDVNLQDDTVWLTQKQIADLFKMERSVVTKHLRNIFSSGELSQNSVCANFAHTAADGKRYTTKFYNLDAVISVGYRANSVRATQFRIWATRVLRDHIVKGYTINENRLKDKQHLKLTELEKAIALLRSAMNSKMLEQKEAVGLLEVITEYANSWLLLQQYDEGKLTVSRKKKKAIMISVESAKTIIEKLRTSLIKKKVASDIFGQERGRGLSSILGCVAQSFNGKDLYSSVEEKAAHLLYFIIKDHPFVDGNKRIASFMFVIFLRQNNYLLNKKGEKKINDNTLVALALLIAQSNPKEKDTMIALITNLL